MSQKQQILEKAEEMYMKLGIKSVSMDDLARNLGISKKTIYQYVENKNDLVSAVVQCHIDEEKIVVLDILENSENAIDEMLKVAKYVISQLRKLSPTVVYDLKKYYRESWQMLERHDQEFVYNHIKTNIERGIKEELYSADVNTDIIARMYVSQNFSVVDEDIFPLQKYNREKLFEQFILYHIRGIACPKGLEVLEELRKK